MKKFIRLDMKGEWRGTEHISSLQGQAGECYCFGFGEECTCGAEKSWEEGISCYRLDDVAEALENLRWYWQEIAMLRVEDYEDMQVTIFEGELLDKVGSDWEDLAICERTLYEFDAKSLMEAIYKLHEEYELGDISEEDYQAKLSKLVA